ncbi:formate dehydrogenase accessory sulfurtransferase FdhD [Phenylobacterium sp.]|uniref:formate dehydrogenase accessory sulfurtransferase FdhD n=1 Tax=Phenylobacterium sp. TaxID=1871053 RepID=UPI002730A8F3|nr:formate dehydrogenase accessory sulfurtransferase FdhD [Phenylobacterium sp.]MDP2212972.1 formate dehydrogenase accessory sulfurtransferase FdhD [Phenylobacterium sp.]
MLRSPDSPDTPDAVRTRPLRFRGEKGLPTPRDVPEETAVAIVHDASTTAVMMATPSDLTDFGLGFSLTEGIIAAPSDVRDMEVIAAEDGIEVRMWLKPRSSAAAAARRRRQAGPTGCGLCGVDSLAQALRAPPTVARGLTFAPEDIHAALEALPQLQTLGEQTRAVHAAGWWSPQSGYVAVREDVGRHNALDKLAGALARETMRAPPGAVVLTSRVSVEMVQKAAVMGAQVIIAVSAPTALAIRTAKSAGMTLIGVARRDGFEVFTGQERLAGVPHLTSDKTASAC